MIRAWLARQPLRLSSRHATRSFSIRTSQRSTLADAPKVHARHERKTDDKANNADPSTSRWPNGFKYLYRHAWQAALFMANFFIFGHLFLNYVAAIRLVVGPSMYPTFEISGDWVLVSYLHRRGRWVEVGDVVSFEHPVRQGYRAMKRIVGMPGDFVLRDTPEGYNSGSSRQQWMVQVPEGHCWVAGDNLEWSRDSRHFGPLPLALIRGKAIARTSRGSFKWHWVGGGLRDFDASDAEV